MHQPIMLRKQQCQTLEPGRALAMRAAAAGVLRVRSGGAWITRDGAGHPCGSAGPRGGDWFLVPGDSFALPRGGRIVLEPRSCAQAVEFDWLPLGGATSDVDLQAAQVARHWRRMRRAGRQCAGALVALVAGLVRWRPAAAAKVC